MRKYNKRWGCILICGVCVLGILSGCQKAVDYVPTQGTIEETAEPLEETKCMEETTEDTVGETEKQMDTQTQVSKNSNGYESLTIDVIRALADKHEGLTIQDLVPYMDVRAVTERNSSLCKEVEFADSGVEYVLRVIASSKSDSDRYSNVLDAVILFRKDYLTLGAQGEGENLRHSGDIRSSNIDHIIDAQVIMSDYVTCVLPDRVQEDIFEAGEYMGTRFLSGDGEEVRVIGSFCIETPYHSLRTNMVEAYEKLPLGAAVMQRTLEQMDESDRQLYIALITREDSGVQYRLYFDAEFFTKEEFLTVTETITMAKNAFY